MNEKKRKRETDEEKEAKKRGIEYTFKKREGCEREDRVLFELDHKLVEHTPGLNILVVNNEIRWRVDEALYNTIERSFLLRTNEPKRILHYWIDDGPSSPSPPQRYYSTELYERVKDDPAVDVESYSTVSDTISVKLRDQKTLEPFMGPTPLRKHALLHATSPRKYTTKFT